MRITKHILVATTFSLIGVAALHSFGAPPTNAPSIQIALQDGFCENLDLSKTVFKNNAVVAGASACSANASMTVAEFNSTTPQQIAETFLANKLGFDPATFTGLVILDIEDPIAPQKWYQQNAAYFAAVKLRIDTIRGLLPKAKLGLYGVVYAPYLGNVHGTGFPDAKHTWLQGPYAGYQAAAAAHVFDSLDYLCPVCPAVWGPGDSPAQVGSIIPSVTVTIEQTAKLGLNLKMAPFLRFKIYSSASKAHGKSVSAQVLTEQIHAAVNTRQVDMILVWAGTQKDIDPKIMSTVGVPSSFE